MSTDSQRIFLGTTPSHKFEQSALLIELRLFIHGMCAYTHDVHIYKSLTKSRQVTLTSNVTTRQRISYCKSEVFQYYGVRKLIYVIYQKQVFHNDVTCDVLF